MTTKAKLESLVCGLLLMAAEADDVADDCHDLGGWIAVTAAAWLRASVAGGLRAMARTGSTVIDLVGRREAA